VSHDPAWLSIVSAASAGTGDVRFSAQPNTSPDPRTGTLTIAGLTYTVTQAGAACSYALSPAQIAVASTGASSSFGFSTAVSGCTPAPVSYAGWIEVTGTTAGDVQFTVAANPSTTTRSGSIRLGDSYFTVVQSGAACGYSINTASHSFGPNGGPGTLLGSPTAVGCNPDFGTDSPSFITLLGLTGPSGNIFTLNFEIAPFPSVTPATRFGRVTFGGQISTVKQKSY
jgi:hypothetical protein